MSKRKPLGPLFIAVLAVAVFAFVYRKTVDTQEAPPELSGRLWVAEESEGEPLLVSLIKEERLYSVRRRFSPSTHKYYTRYTLIARKLSDGSVAARMKVRDIVRNSGQPQPELIGVAGGRAWLWDGGLAAYTLPRLDPSFSAESWGARAAAVAELLPAKSDEFRITPDRRHLAFRGRDARIYRIEADDGDVAVISPELFPATTRSQQMEDRFVHYRPPEMSRIVTNVSHFTQKGYRAADGYWYALLSESELKGLGRRVSVDIRPYGDVARAYYRIPYEWDGRYAVIDPPRTETLGDVRLIQAGFVEREFFQIWTVPDPASALALARPKLGPDVPWDLVRLGHDGQIVWRTSTGLADIYGFLPTTRDVVFVGQRLPASVAGSKGDRREYAVTIDVTTGKSRQFDVGDD